MSENAITRRSFLAGSAGVAAVAAGAGFLSFNAWEQADARGTSDIDHYTAHSLCNSCSSKCGFTGYVVDGKLGKMIGDANHPNCEGTLCGRGYGFASIAYNEDRLTDPLKKNGGKFEKITWDQAYSEIAEKVKAIIDEKGPGARHGAGPAPERLVLHQAFHERTWQPERLHARCCLQHVEERWVYSGHRHG